MSRFIATGVVLLVALTVSVFFFRMFPPELLEKTPDPAAGYDQAPMQAATTTSVVEDQMGQILSLGSRFMGQDGHKAMLTHMKNAYQAAGLEILEQENYCAAPRTSIRRISEAGGQVLPDVEVYPFMPNNLQPMNTPDEGLTGELILINQETLATRKSFSNGIGLISAKAGELPETLGFLWARYARLGLKALIVSHPDGLAEMPWDRVASGDECMVSTLPINYVRVTATPEIFAHVGKEVCLTVRTAFAETRHTTLFGILRSPQASESALILSCDYDACSMLPDLAPGAMQALGPALHLQLLAGLLPYRDQLKRDILFIAYGGEMMGHDGKYNLLRLLGANSGSQAATENPVLRGLGIEEEQEDAGVASPVRKRLAQQQVDNDAALQIIEEITSTWPEKSRSSLTPEAQVVFDQQIEYVLNGLILTLSEPMLQAKITFEKRGDGDIESAEFAAYQAAKSVYEKAMAAAGFSLEQILASKQAFVAQHGVMDRFKQRFADLLAYHQRRQRQLTQDLTVLDLLGGYGEKVFVHPLLAPANREGAAEEMTILAGYDADTQPKLFTELLGHASRATSGVKVRSYEKDHERTNASQIGSAPGGFIYPFGGAAGHAFFAPISYNRGDAYSKYGYPVAEPFMTELDSLSGTLPTIAETVLSLAMGSGTGEFPGRAGRVSTNGASVNLGGRVLVSNVGQSMVPSFPLAGAVITGFRQQYVINPGYYSNPFYLTDPYGGYDLPYHVLGFASHHPNGYSPVAVGYGDDGTIALIKDEGPNGQRLFKSTGISTWVTEIMQSVTIVTFRAAPMCLLDLLNPQTMREYSGVELVDKHGLATPEKICRFPFSGVAEGVQTTFVPPEESYYIKLLSGTADNEFANETRAFLLNVEKGFVGEPDREIDGAGYLAQDNSLIYDVTSDAARSMSFLNGKRLDLQKRHHMSDERTEDYHGKGEALTRESESGDLPLAEAVRKSRESITYSTLNHPILRESIFEAVLGILWYLGLLVPFVFFFEKLVFGYSDIRKQLVAQSIVFVIVFALLNVLHPAFSMVRSSMMILLGFVIMLVSGGVAIMSSGKFHENLEELRKRSGKVKAADVNLMSAIGSAVMLGLNNMHRRKVRTGLTCATLVVMTFVMICFTSVQSDLVDSQISLGKAPYQGFLVKKDNFRGLTSGEVYALNEEYGHLYDICPRTALIGSIDWESNYSNPEIEAVFTSESGITRSATFQSILTFNEHDPIQHALEFLEPSSWFSAEDCLASQDAPPVIIPDTVAEQLGISPAQVTAGTASLKIESRDYQVKGIFKAESLAQLRDLDGQDLLPFDIDALETVALDSAAGQVVAEVDAIRLSPGSVILFPADRDPVACQSLYSKKVISSVAVSMPDLDYAEARDRILAYMERSAQSVYYGLDGMAYVGKRTRETSLAGLLDMLIPLLLTGLVVLNTIRGSVYERREEIYVYNAIGIAPRYVFFMFFAEAIVYAVVGAVMGYLMSQGVGRVLTELEMTGGLNMTFTSLTTIYASLAIAAATIISTFFPARTAMEIASPADDAGWKLPEPKGDILAFDLPFTFTHRDRIAVLAFFERYLQNHGEGSSGRFFATPPTVEISEKLDELADGAYIPRVVTTIWLKPYDLSVSQQMRISLPTDANTGEFIAHIELIRLSGTRESWMRLNQGFVAQVRKHFLHWRAVGDEDREEMFDEAVTLLRGGAV